MIRRILLVLSVAAVVAAMMVASAMPAFAQGRGPEGGNPGIGLERIQEENRTVGANDLKPLPFGGQDVEVLPGKPGRVDIEEGKGSEQALFNAGPAVVCKAPGSHFFAPEIRP